MSISVLAKKLQHRFLEGILMHLYSLAVFAHEETTRRHFLLIRKKGTYSNLPVTPISKVLALNKISGQDEIPIERFVPKTHKKMKFPIKDFFSKCDQIRSKLRIWSHLLRNSLMKNLIFCAVQTSQHFLVQIEQRKHQDIVM